VFSLEKYYCEKCRVLYDEEENCHICGSVANKKIYIEVQNQSEKK
jgi:rRNA maturation endonuclease Nob1